MKKEKRKKTIAWALAGEGRGHASRNLTLILEMRRRGHAIDIYTYGDTLESLEEYFHGHPLEKQGITLLGIPGMFIQYNRQGKVSLAKVFTKNLKPFFETVRGFNRIVRMIRKKEYDLFVIDFEPLMSRAVIMAGVTAPVIQASASQAAIVYSQLEIPKNITRTEYQVFKNLVRAFQPRPDRVLITTFYRPGKLKKRTTYAGAIIRPEIERAHPREEGFILVYMKPIVEDVLLPLVDAVAREMHQRFIIYTPHPEKFEKYSKCILMKRTANTPGFMNDVIRSDGIIATGGSEFIAEAIWLNKPFFSIMQTWQYEQYINGHYLVKNGLGMACVSVELTQRKIERFIRDRQRFKKDLAVYKQHAVWGTHTIPNILESYLK